MDSETANFYRREAASVADRYEGVASPLERHLSLAFALGARLLDIGIGSGRDLALLRAQGFDAFGVEPIDALREEALLRHPELTARVCPGALPDIGTPFGGNFDGILCSAVLMHVPEGELFDTAFTLRRLLRPHGRLLISLPLTRGDVTQGERAPDGRLFKCYSPEYLQLLFERLGLQLIGRWDTSDALGRAGTTWYVLLFELRSGSTTRPVDQIEGILNRDKKVATYKLALFRALAELATQEPRVVSWRTDGQVGIALRRIAEKWLVYYWPIFAAPNFTPQSSAEGMGSGKRVLFRQAVHELVALYSEAGENGGISAWQLDVNAGRLSPAAATLQERALRSITAAIRKGPVEFAGGSLDGGRVFSFDAAQGEVLMSADLWRELSLLGHWIIDAVILRWAELTERFAHRQGIRSGDVLPLLLARAEPVRATAAARDIFVRAGWDRCAWSDRRLNKGLVVDHVIPFSLWGSNDLWNLLPADPRVNNEKSDKLPAAQLLSARRDCIIDAWRLLRNAVPKPFDRQASHLLGRNGFGGSNWEDLLFARLREAVEVTALQRGVERWVPRTRAPVAGVPSA